MQVDSRDRRSPRITAPGGPHLSGTARARRGFWGTVLGETTWSLVLAAALAGAAGCKTNCRTEDGKTICEAEALKRYDFDQEFDQDVSYDVVPGQNLSVTVRHGTVMLDRSDSDQVQVHFDPYNSRGASERDEARDELERELVLEYPDDASDDDTLEIVATVNDSDEDSVGTDIIIGIPEDFDGEITIHNEGRGNDIQARDINVNYIGNATRVSLENESQLGDCETVGGPSLEHTDIDCNHRVQAAEMVGTFDISGGDSFSDEDDDGNVIPGVLVEVSEVPDADLAGKLYGEREVGLILPKDAEFYVQALTNVDSGDGEVETPGLPSACDVETAEADGEPDPRSRTVTCNGATEDSPRYEVEAEGGLLEGSVYIIIR